MDIPRFDAVLEARLRIRPWVHRTPVLTSRFFNALSGAELFFKCENFQKTGVFKARGASNAVFGLTDRKAVRGVATHSSGNHALSLAYAAGARGIPAIVVMPHTAPQAKKDAVRAYGGRIVECAPSLPSRETSAATVLSETGAAFVHPYNDARVIAGQGTCAVELIEQVPDLDALIAPIGGGGMVSGVCLAVSGLAPHMAVFAAEPEQADDAARSFRAGRLIGADMPDTIADGLKMPLGELTWHFVSRRVQDILTVSEAEIIRAMRQFWARMKTIMEPSSAVPLAAILKHPKIFAGKRVGVIVTGGNVDLERLPWLNGGGTPRGESA